MLFSVLPFPLTFVLSNFKNYIMKNLRKSCLIILMSFFSLSGFSMNHQNEMNDKESKITEVTLANVKQGSQLRIKDVMGIVHYKESIVKDGDYSKGFDLTSLPDGEYFFELESEMEIVIIPFRVQSNQVAFNKKDKSTIFKPVVRLKGSLVYVSRVSFAAEPIEYKVYFAENSDLVLTEKFENDSHVKKVYDFSGAQKGDYVFVFLSNGRKYTRTIKI